MPYHIGTSDECPASKPHAVVKDDDGEVMGCHPSKDAAMKQMQALHADETKAKSFDPEIRTFPFAVEEVRDAEGGRSHDFTIKGHAAVYDTWTDLGVFRERIARGAFDDVLASDPHVLHLIDHDTRYVLSSTRNKTLELRSDPKGLHMWSKVAPTSYAADLRVLMERGDVSQSSFAFTVPDDGQKWRETDDGAIERTITRVDGLYDVTTTAMGAYPTTDSQVASRTLERARAVAEKRLPEPTPAETPDTTAADDRPAGEGTEPPLDPEAGSEAITAEQIAAARDGADLWALKRAARNRVEAARALRDQLEKDLKWR